MIGCCLARKHGHLGIETFQLLQCRASTGLRCQLVIINQILRVSGLPMSSAPAPVTPAGARDAGRRLPDVLAAAVELHRNGSRQLVTLNAEMTMTALAQPSWGKRFEPRT